MANGLGMVPGTQKHSAAAKGKASAAFKAIHVTGGAGPCMASPLLSACVCVRVCVYRWHKPQSSCVCKPHHSSSRAQRSPSPQILSFPAADAQWPMSAARASVRALTPYCASVFCLSVFASQAGGEGQGWGRTSTWDSSCSHFTGEERNLIFLLHLKRETLHLK